APSILRNGGDAGACIASVSSRTSAGSGSGGGGGDAGSGGSSVRPAIMASISSCLFAAATGAGAGLGGGGGGGAFATGGGSAALTSGAFASGLAGGCPPSSSAMILRMEARISSIEGSCAFAACVIRRFPLAFPDRHAATRESAAHTRNMRGFAGVWHQEGRTQAKSCGQEPRTYK